jgi:hypothetical protein
VSTLVPLLHSAHQLPRMAEHRRRRSHRGGSAAQQHAAGCDATLTRCDAAATRVQMKPMQTCGLVSRVVFLSAQVRAHVPLTCAHAHVAATHTHTPTNARTDTPINQTHMHAHRHAHTRARTHTHTHATAQTHADRHADATAQTHTLVFLSLQVAIANTAADERFDHICTGTGLTPAVAAPGLGSSPP